MANVQYYDVILKPVVTEKSMELMGEKKYTFLVHPEATKSQIKEAVEKMFTGTKVEKVNTMNNDGKKKRVRGTYNCKKNGVEQIAIEEFPCFVIWKVQSTIFMEKVDFFCFRWFIYFIKSLQIIHQ